MNIPDYQTIMLPLLTYASDGNEHASREPVDALAKHFNLSELELNELLSNGKPVFVDRVSWALTYLRQARLVESTRRGFFRITQRGITVCEQQPPRIDNHFLAQYAEFRDFLQRKGKSARDIHEQAERNGSLARPAVDLALEQHETPNELLDGAFQAIRQNLAAELLERVKECSPTFFEQLVVELLVKMGYGGSRKDAGEAVGRSGDEGIDGIIKEDRLGLDIIYIQAKRWGNTVGRPDIHQFAGALAGKRARKGIFITTSTFSREAREYVAGVDTKIALIDGKELAELMLDHDIGVTPVTTYLVKRVDSDYFSEE